MRAARLVHRVGMTEDGAAREEVHRILARAIHDWSVADGIEEDSREMHVACLLQADELLSLMEPDDVTAMGRALLARRPGS
jgi:hypothetical protein